MKKPWWKSISITGAIASGVGILLSPEVFAILPEPYAKTVAVVGAVASAIGLRRSLPPKDVR